MRGEDIGFLLRHEQGQFLEFLSAYDYPRRGGTQKKRADDLAREIARVVSGMANADGGTLLVGVEPDKSITGIPHDPDEFETIVQAPVTLLTPSLVAPAQSIKLGNLLLVKYEVPSGLELYRFSGGRSFYRIGTETPSLTPEQIQSLKESKRSVAYERQHARNATWEDLDHTAIETLKEKAQDPRDLPVFLAHQYHLLDLSQDRVAPTLAALLLFGKDPTLWHPRCGIDFVKYDGTERHYGASLNVIKRLRFEGPLVRLIDETIARIKEHIRERTILHDLFFRERFEYPTYAWQEAIINAVAHRDYAISGTANEVWMFDDHIAVRSPGLPPPPVTLEQLRQQKSVHFSRNPLIVRVLGDLGYLREMGEGVPRMFQEMEQYGLHPPEFSAEGFVFVVTLRNTPVYDDEILRWLNQFNPARVSFRQRRLLAYAYCHGKTFSTTEYQRIAEVDRDTAYREIRSLVKNGVVAPLKPKSRSYRIIEPL